MITQIKETNRSGGIYVQNAARQKERLHGDLTEKIIALCFKAHRELGPGFSERVYHNALKQELVKERIDFQMEKEYDITYHETKIGSLRLDLVIQNKVVVEVKAVTGKPPELFRHQVLSYLKVTGLNVGLLVNFGNKSCQISRIIQ